MRIVILALFIIAGAIAFAQSGPVGPLSPNHSDGLPSTGTAQSRDFGKLPPGWQMTSIPPLGKTWVVTPKPLVPLGDAQIDPKIIVHPPQSLIGVQPPGTQIAQNQFPGLKLLPIQWPNLKIEPIPTIWPNLKLEPLATVCTGCEMVPFRAGAAATMKPQKNK
jgi:hypothetical protein